MNTPRNNTGSEKGMSYQHRHPSSCVARDDPARDGVLVFDPLHAFFPVVLPSWMILIPIQEGKPTLDTWSGVHCTRARVDAVQSLSRGLGGPIPVGIVSAPPLPEISAITLKIPRDPEDIAFCLAHGRPRSEAAISRIAELMDGVRTDFIADGSSDPKSIIDLLGQLFVYGNGCHKRDHRWLASKIISRHHPL